ncbi:MAG: SDR family oxidoreductase, partial [Candidatus Puniceispirillaceae bacterium]
SGPPRHLLMTGATGFLGAHALAEVLERTEARVTCLIRGGDRARVLKVRSIMDRGKRAKASHGAVDANMSLESLIAHAEGDIDRSFAVHEDEDHVGSITMKAVFKALVRYDLGGNGRANGGTNEAG